MAIGYEEVVPRPPLLHRVTKRQLQNIDFAIAVLLFIGSAHGAFSTGRVQHSPEVLSLAIIAGLSIAIRRKAPMSALVLVTISIAIATAVGDTWVPEPFIAIPMFQVASVRDRRRSFPALVLVVITLLASSGVGLLADHHNGQAAFGIVVAIAVWFVGDSVRVRRVYVSGLAEQAAQRQREAVERAQRSVAEERLQIARELHDVVAHSLSVIAVQSGVGRHVIREQPEEAEKALAAVEATSRSALDELRRMLGILRSENQEPALLVPAPGIGGLAQLVDQVRAAGVAVDLQIKSAAVHRVSPSVELTIYRIVQEALTNVVKHAGPASVHVELRDESDVLAVEILDDGCGIAKIPPYPLESNIPDAHHGIVGMRERVALFNGSLFAGPRPEGGFRVLARFPLAGLQSS